MSLLKSLNVEKEPAFPQVPGEAGLRRQQEPWLGWVVTTVAGIVGLLAVPTIVLYLAFSGGEILFGDRAFTLFSAEWRPGEEIFGLVPLVVGTMTTSILALVLAVPLGLGVVIHLVYFSSGRLQNFGEATLGILGGTPSVVFGLFGTVWLVPYMGPSLGAAMLVLAMMVLPTFALLALAALRQLPEDMWTAGAALGLRREQIIWHIALKETWPQLTAAATLALARCLGEALAVEMVAGNVAGIPTSLLQPIRTLTTTLVQEFEYARGSHSEALHLVALTVVLIAAAASGLALRLYDMRGRK
jgi:phosphate transport system permease protein